MNIQAAAQDAMQDVKTRPAKSLQGELMQMHVNTEYIHAMKNTENST